MNNEITQQYINRQIEHINTLIDSQAKKKHQLQITMYLLSILSLFFSSSIPIIDSFKPKNTLTILSTISSVCNAIVIGMLTKFNISKKIEQCGSNIINLNYSRQKLIKYQGIDRMDTSQAKKRKISSIIENISTLDL